MKIAVATRSLLITIVALTASLLSVGASAAGEVDSAKAPSVLITGANRGLGLEFARQYAADGWQVIGTARKPDDAVELKALRVRTMPLDVTSQQSVDALAEALDGHSIDLLINNAGIFPRVSTIADINIDDYSRTLAVNLLGPVRVTRALLPNLQGSELKTVINITSQLGSIGLNTSGNFYGYRESKAGLNMFSRTLAKELAGDGFTVVTLHPGWVRTDMGGANAPLTPEKSVSMMRSVIDGLTPVANGTYLSYKGEEVPW